LRHRSVLVASMASWLLAACVFVTASAVCDTTASAETGSCAAANKGTIAEEIAFVQLASDVRAAAQRNGLKEAGLGQDDGQLVGPDQLFPPMGPIFKGLISDMVKNISGQVMAQKDALCKSIRGEVTDPLAAWLRSMSKRFKDASEHLEVGANKAGEIAASAVKDSLGKGDINDVITHVEQLLGETAKNTTKQMASLAIQVEKLRANFSRTLDEVGLHGLAKHVSGARVNETADLVMKTLKTLEEASVGMVNESVKITDKVIATCRENVGKTFHSIDILTSVVELVLRDLVMQLHVRLLPVIGRAPPECRGGLPLAILDANQTVTTSSANLKQANLKFHIGMKKVLAILTETLEKIKSGKSAARKEIKVAKKNENTDEKTQGKKDNKKKGKPKDGLEKEMEDKLVKLLG